MMTAKQTMKGLYLQEEFTVGTQGRVFSALNEFDADGNISWWWQASGSDEVTGPFSSREAATKGVEPSKSVPKV